ncbi:YezD family protein [Alishewanella longhuensis]
MSDTIKNTEALAPLLEQIKDLLGHIEYGSVELIFHHGKLVQLEKHEKVRFDKN